MTQNTLREKQRIVKLKFSNRTSKIARFAKVNIANKPIFIEIAELGNGKYYFRLEQNCELQMCRSFLLDFAFNLHFKLPENR